MDPEKVGNKILQTKSLCDIWTVQKKKIHIIHLQTLTHMNISEVTVTVPRV